MVIFSGFNTLSDVQELIFDSARRPQSQGFVEVVFLIFMTDIHQAQGFTGDGFTGLAIIYITFAVANWAAPAFVECIGRYLL